MSQSKESRECISLVPQSRTRLPQIVLYVGIPQLLTELVLQAEVYSQLRQNYN